MIKILSTRQEELSSFHLAGRFGIELAQEPMIKINKSVNPHEIAEVLDNNSSEAIAFTSRSAVNALLTSDQALDTIRTKIVYAIGNRSAAPLLDQQIKVSIPGKSTGKSLADLLIRDGVRSVLFPCGQLRYPDFPNSLFENGINVEEWEVYRTLKTPKKVDEANYNGVLFFSPTSVQSFFELNQSVEKAFAIGNSTAKELRLYVTEDQIIISPKPSFKVLIELVHDHFVYSAGK